LPIEEPSMPDVLLRVVVIAVVGGLPPAHRATRRHDEVMLTLAPGGEARVVDRAGAGFA
jgi:hypothetical protein